MIKIECRCDNCGSIIEFDVDVIPPYNNPILYPKSQEFRLLANPQTNQLTYCCCELCLEFWLAKNAQGITVGRYTSNGLVEEEVKKVN